MVLSLDARVGDFAQADVLIEDGRIREVRPAIALSEEATAVVDAGRRIVLPGFIDTHHHFYQASCATSSPTACSTPTTIAT